MDEAGTATVCQAAGMPPDAPAPRVVVQGEAVVSAPPDQASVTVTVTTRDRRSDRAVAALAAAQRQLTDLLERSAAAVGEHATERVTVHPELAPQSRRVTGHVASLTTRVRLEDTDAVGEFVVAAAGIEGAAVFGPTWTLRRDSPAHQQARDAAVTDALDRARTHAAALGCTLTGLVELRDVAGGRAGPVLFAAAARSGGRDAELDLEPARQEARGHVELTCTVSAPDPEVLL